MARIIRAEELQVQINKLISAKKQIGEFTVDLTVREVFKLKSGGRLDFGGSEYREGSTQRCPPIKRNPEDAYGWWELPEGDYLLQLNETLSLEENQVAIIQPHPRFLSIGCFHSSLMVKSLDEELRIPFHVLRTGVNIKQNARISRLMVLEL